MIARAKLRVRPLQLAPLCPISESQGSSFARWVGVRHMLQPSCVVSVLVGLARSRSMGRLLTFSFDSSREQLLRRVLQEGVRSMTFPRSDFSVLRAAL